VSILAVLLIGSILIGEIEKQVKAGEELFLDYGETYWIDDNDDDDETTDIKDAQDPHI